MSPKHRFIRWISLSAFGQQHTLSITLAIVLGALLVFPNCTVADVTRHDTDICVYGGTASGVMAALAAKKEGANVIIVEPSRWLGGMTGGGINHLDWGKGNTVGGSTYKILMEGLKEHKREHQGHAVRGIGNKQYRERFKKAVKDQGITVDLRAPLCQPRMLFIES